MVKSVKAELLAEKKRLIDIPNVESEIKRVEDVTKDVTKWIELAQAVIVAILAAVAGGPAVVIAGGMLSAGAISKIGQAIAKFMDKSRLDSLHSKLADHKGEHAKAKLNSLANKLQSAKLKCGAIKALNKSKLADLENQIVGKFNSYRRLGQELDVESTKRYGELPSGVLSASGKKKGDEDGAYTQFMKMAANVRELAVFADHAIEIADQELKTPHRALSDAMLGLTFTYENPDYDDSYESDSNTKTRKPTADQQRHEQALRNALASARQLYGQSSPLGAELRQTKAWAEKWKQLAHKLLGGKKGDIDPNY